jgi:ArsR family transcriptional regulator
LNQNSNPAAQSRPFPGTTGAPSNALFAAPPGGPSRHDGSVDRNATPAPAQRRDATPSGDVSRLLSLLADRTRLKILRILADGERPVVALTSELRLPQPTVSHHLAWLRMMDLVSPRRQGKHVFYALGPAAQCDAAGVLTLTADDATVTITPYTGG